jgi:hypothetical protein
MNIPDEMLGKMSRKWNRPLYRLLDDGRAQKLCPVCGEYKSLGDPDDETDTGEYTVHSASSDGLHSWCSECKRRKWRERNDHYNRKRHTNTKRRRTQALARLASEAEAARAAGVIDKRVFWDVGDGYIGDIIGLDDRGVWLLLDDRTPLEHGKLRSDDEYVVRVASRYIAIITPKFEAAFWADHAARQAEIAALYQRQGVV